MKALEKLFGRSAADIEAALAKATAEAESASVAVAAHAELKLEASAEGENARREWAQKHEKLQETAVIKRDLVEPLKLALDEAKARELVSANRARCEAIEKRLAAAAARGPEVERALAAAAEIFAELEAAEEERRTAIAQKIPGMEKVRGVAERLSRSPHGCKDIWREAKLPSIFHQFDFHWPRQAQGPVAEDRQAAPNRGERRSPDRDLGFPLAQTSVRHARQKARHLPSAQPH